MDPVIPDRLQRDCDHPEAKIAAARRFVRSVLFWALNLICFENPNKQVG
jgi:hypothetical protein